MLENEMLLGGKDNGLEMHEADDHPENGENKDAANNATL